MQSHHTVAVGCSEAFTIGRDRDLHERRTDVDACGLSYRSRIEYAQHSIATGDEQVLARERDRCSRL
jgi:hypothetical protein